MTTRNGDGNNSDRALVDGIAVLSRSLSIVSTALIDVGLALVTVNVQAGPQGSPTTIAAMNSLHGAQDEIAEMQRQMMALLENVHARTPAGS